MFNESAASDNRDSKKETDQLKKWKDSSITIDKFNVPWILTSDDTGDCKYNFESQQWQDMEGNIIEIPEWLIDKAKRIYYNNQNILFRGLEFGDVKGQRLSEFAFMAQVALGDMEMTKLLELTKVSLEQNYVEGGTVKGTSHYGDETWDDGSEYYREGYYTGTFSLKIDLRAKQIGSISLPNDISFKSGEVAKDYKITKEDEELGQKAVQEYFFSKLVTMCSETDMNRLLKDDSLFKEIVGFVKKFIKENNAYPSVQDFQDEIDDTTKAELSSAIHTQYADKELRDTWDNDVVNLLNEVKNEVGVLRHLDNAFYREIEILQHGLQEDYENQKNDRPTIIDKLRIILQKIRNRKVELDLKMEMEKVVLENKEKEKEVLAPKIRKILESVSPTLFEQHNRFHSRDPLVVSYYSIQGACDDWEHSDLNDALVAAEKLKEEMEKQYSEEMKLLNHDHSDWRTPIAKEFIEVANGKNIKGEIIVRDQTITDIHGRPVTGIAMGNGKYGIEKTNKAVKLQYYTGGGKPDGDLYVLGDGDFVITKHNGIFEVEFTKKGTVLRVLKKVDPELFSHQTTDNESKNTHNVFATKIDLTTRAVDRQKFDQKLKTNDEPQKNKELLNENELAKILEELHTFMDELEIIQLVVGNNERSNKLKTRISDRINILKDTSKTKATTEIKKIKKEIEGIKEDASENNWPLDWIERARIAFKIAVPELKNKGIDSADIDTKIILESVLSGEIQTEELENTIIELFS